MDTQIENKLAEAIVGTSRRHLKIKITDGKEFDEIREGNSFKKIIKSVQGSVPKGTQYLYVEYTNRKGTLVNRAVKIPMGRKKKLGR
jgi:hypothetical protein